MLMCSHHSPTERKTGLEIFLMHVYVLRNKKARRGWYWKKLKRTRLETTCSKQCASKFNISVISLTAVTAFHYIMNIIKMISLL